MGMLFQHNTLDQVAITTSYYALVKYCTYVRTFNKQSGNFLVTSSSSTPWNDTVRGADVGLVTERIKVTSSYSGERHTCRKLHGGVCTGDKVHTHRARN